MEEKKYEREIVPTREVCNNALGYSSIGWSVIPLGEITKDSLGTKHLEFPPGGWKRYQTERATLKEIGTWNPINLGIVTGEISGLVVLDVDSYKPGFDSALLESFELPLTPVQRTASGGKQYFFKLPAGVVIKNVVIKNAVCIGKKDSGIDVRSEGGMVIVAPSTTPYGKYEWEISPFVQPLAEVPPKLLELLTSKSEVLNDVKVVSRESTEIKEGERNNAMTSFIGKLLVSTPRDQWDTEVLQKAQEENNTYNPPMQIDEVRKIYDSITKRELEQSPRLTVKKEPNQFSPAISHVELMRKQFPPTRFTLEPFFEKGTLNMVSAPPNHWKSWILLLFAHHIATGDSVFGEFPTEKSSVMIVNEEDNARLIQERMALMGVKDADLPIQYRISHGSKLDDVFVGKLIKEAKEKNISVIMFDSLRAMHDKEENDSTAMQGVMDLLKKITREDITVVFTHHHRKKSGFQKTDAESARGSSAILAAISGHISLEEEIRVDGDFILVSHLKSKVSKKITPFEISIQREGGKISFQYAGEKKQKEPALKEACEKILSILKDRTEYFAVKDLVSIGAGSKNTVKDALQQLKNQKKVQTIERKNMKKMGFMPYNDIGAPNEKLHSINKDDIDDEDD